MEVTRRRIGIVSRTIIVVGGVCDIKDDRARRKVEDDGALVVSRGACRADRHGIQDGSSTCYGHRDAEAAIRRHLGTDHAGLAVGVGVGGRHVDGITHCRLAGNHHRGAIDR